MSNVSIKIPCLRGRMGDWFYYVSLMRFSEIAKRVSMVPDIHKNKELNRWIQREISGRTDDIVSYLLEQNQRFFNSIIFGIYGGRPQWQEIDIDKKDEQLTEEERDYFGKTFGILNLNGEEEIFAIDGQHRTKAIQDAVKKNPQLNEEEVAVIFLAHRKTPDGEIRTRRLFSTLNRYAVPVTISEIIALDEEDNCAILTRQLMEGYDLFKDKVQFSKGRSINVNNKDHFTNIVLLYDIISIYLTNKSFSKSVKPKGYDVQTFTRKRESEEVLNKELDNLKEYFKKIFESIPSLQSYFFKEAKIGRTLSSTSLLFRPIGQLIMFYTLKIAKDHKKQNKALSFFAKDDFNLKNKIWKKLFVDRETNTLKTDKPRQTLAIQLILIHLGIDVQMTVKEKEVYAKFKIDPLYL